MAEGFSKNLIKGYKYWEIYVHENQGYLGRCVVWCKREDVLDLADAMPEEQAELFLVLRDLREATKKVFQPNWFNYSFLGNETRHLHGHFIPRYAKPKTFSSRQFFQKRKPKPARIPPQTPPPRGRDHRPASFAPEK